MCRAAYTLDKDYWRIPCKVYHLASFLTSVNRDNTHLSGQLKCIISRKKPFPFRSILLVTSLFDYCNLSKMISLTRTGHVIKTSNHQRVTSIGIVLLTCHVAPARSHLSHPGRRPRCSGRETRREPGEPSEASVTHEKTGGGKQDAGDQKPL